MNSQEFRKIITKFPDTPGVYFFMREKEVLYIGKATSLKDRVKSYFSKDIFETRGPKIVKMLELANGIDFQKTDSVLEALLLESHLIKKNQPEYNTLEKDDKSFNFVVITKEDFPRVLVVRGRDILISNLSKPDSKIDFKIKESFGPFPSGTDIKTGLKIIRKIFPFRDKCLPCIDSTKNICKPCFNRQLGLCPGVCSGEISKSEYQKNIKNIVRFFKGEKQMIIKDLNLQMKDFAKNNEFEKASLVKKKIFALNHIQDVSLIKNDFLREGMDDGDKSVFRIESYDIAHLGGTNVVGVMTVLENGEINKNEYRKFKIKDSPSNNDLKSLEEVFSRRLKHTEWKKPDLIVVDGGENQRKLFRKILNENTFSDWQGIPVVSVVKDEKHRAREILSENDIENELKKKYEKEILLSNAEAHRFAIGFHKKLRDKIF